MTFKSFLTILILVAGIALLIFGVMDRLWWIVIAGIGFCTIGVYLMPRRTS